MNTHVRGQNLTYSIANHIGIAIVTGVYSADNPIPIEAELCRQYGASRPVLREAVKMLTAKGLLGARPRRGTWVQPEDKWNLLDPDVLLSENRKVDLAREAMRKLIQEAMDLICKREAQERRAGIRTLRADRP